MTRRTKIVATIGPASDAPGVLADLVSAGVDVARIGLAHGTARDHIERIDRIRTAARAAGRPVGILADLPGPKVRTGELGDEPGVVLVEGDPLVLGIGTGPAERGRIEVDYPQLTQELSVGDRVALGDGDVLLEVAEVGSDEVITRVCTGGRLRGRPGVHLPASRVRVTVPTPDDLRLLEAVVLPAGVEMVAVSFVRGAGDIATVREAVGPDGPMVVAKIETRAAVEQLEEIIDVADAVMVARGDLGIALPLEDVPHAQKRIIRTCVAFGRPVITATQMLESMTSSPVPTRAEASDVANAVFDGTDALMLSGETAIGHDPAAVVRTMARIAERAEQEADYVQWGTRLGRLQRVAEISPRLAITAAISHAGWQAALTVDADAIICCTRSGATARAVARFRPPIPLIAFTPSQRTACQLGLTWGVEPHLLAEHASTDDIVWFAIEQACSEGLVHAGDVVAVLAGSPTDPEPITDSLRLIRVRAP